MAEEKMVTIKAPVTMHDGQQYVAPGSEITLSEREARRVIGQHGEFGSGALKMDPANANVLNAMDKASLDQLNVNAGIFGGHGQNAPLAGTHIERDIRGPKAPLPSDGQLEAMKKEDLVALAAERETAISNDDTKAEIIAKLKADK